MLNVKQMLMVFGICTGVLLVLRAPVAIAGGGRGEPPGASCDRERQKFVIPAFTGVLNLTESGQILVRGTLNMMTRDCRFEFVDDPFGVEGTQLEVVTAGDIQDVCINKFPDGDCPNECAGLAQVVGASPPILTSPTTATATVVVMCIEGRPGGRPE